MANNNQTRLSQDLFVDGDIESTGNMQVNGDLLVSGFVGQPPQNDSITKCSAIFTDLTGSLSKTLENVEFVNNFNSGDKIRIYNASPQGFSQTLDTPNTTIQLYSPPSTLDDLSSSTSFYYKIADFDLTNGLISQSSGAYSINVLFPIDEFSVERFIKLTFTNTPNENNAILVYRSVGDASNYKLCAVLGPKDYQQSYIDYYTFDYTAWSGKNIEDNTYPDSIVHVPTTPPTSPKKGWTDATIEAVDYIGNTIFLTEDIVADTGNLVVNISHDDTELLQTRINTLYNDYNLKNLNLGGKTYAVSGLVIPDDFAISGVPNLSKLKKLPWSVYRDGTVDNIMLNCDTTANNPKISLVDFDIDGNMLEQVLASDESSEQINYAVNLGFESNQCVLNKNRIYNVIGGGVYTPYSNRFKITDSEIRDSALSDRYDFSPIVANNSTDIIVSGNGFNNFSNYLNFSLSYKGVVLNNIIENCGTGVYIYGSRFFISSPNVLMGPADELLPNPDILNSEYDSVNIILENNTPFQSSVMSYSENGEPFDIVSHERNNVQYDVWKLEKTSDGIERLYEQLTDITISNVIDSEVIPEEGDFKFAIPQLSVNSIINDYSVTDMRQVNGNHEGIVYRALLEEYVPAGTIIPLGSVAGEIQTQQYDYKILVQDARYLYVGAPVLIEGHDGFQLDSGVSEIGEIYSLITTAGLTEVVIRYEGNVVSIGQNTESLGSITIINKFIMAKGFVL